MSCCYITLPLCWPSVCSLFMKQNTNGEIGDTRHNRSSLPLPPSSPHIWVSLPSPSLRGSSHLHSQNTDTDTARIISSLLYTCYCQDNCSLLYPWYCQGNCSLFSQHKGLARGILDLLTGAWEPQLRVRVILLQGRAWGGDHQLAETRGSSAPALRS